MCGCGTAWKFVTCAQSMQAHTRVPTTHAQDVWELFGRSMLKDFRSSKPRRIDDGAKGEEELNKLLAGMT